MKRGTSTILALFLVAATVTLAHAQDEAAAPPKPEEEATGPGEEAYKNEYTGQFSPGTGFDIFKTSRGSLNISMYGLVRYLNQMPGNQTFKDHLGRERAVVARNDINWHRTFIWLSGFFWNPRFRYTISVWSLPTTEQNLVFGLFRFTISRALTLGAGVGPNLTARSMQGTWPFWASSDRQMAEEFYRGGFATAFFLTGEPIDRVYYTASINRSLSQLGITAVNDNRSFSFSGSIWAMPTTGELGPRGGFGDLEDHERLATRFGASACHAHENRYAPDDESPRHTQIKLSDGVNPFEAGALADGVTVEGLNYDELAFDAAFKYRGFSLNGEYGLRRLSNFSATGPLPDDSIVDHSFFVQAMQMVIKRRVGVYTTFSYVLDEFDRKPWEISAGASYWPAGNRSLRLNFHYIHVEKSPTGSNFGMYTAGQTGNTISIGVDMLL